MFYLPRSQLQNESSLSGEDLSAVDWPARFRELAASARHPALQQYYQAGVPAGSTAIADVPMVAMDFETTGLDPQQGGIVSIGLVPMTLARISCAGAVHWIVRPRARLSHESIVVHGITHSDIAAAPDISKVLDDLLAQLAGRVVVAHHRSIERRFLSNALQARIGESIEFPVIDTMALAYRVRREPGFWQRLRGRKPDSVRLADCRRRYHLPFYRPHHAQTDALACAELLQAQIAHHFSPQTALSDLWC